MEDKPTYSIIKADELRKHHREAFAELLEEQGKVEGNLSTKVDRCRLICFALLEEQPVGIAAIKPKSKSDFSKSKSGLVKLEKNFEWELGYVFSAREGKGIASEMIARLLFEVENENLMATTEIETNPGMVRILKNNGFKRCGNSWPSKIHGDSLGLFLRCPSE